MLKKRDKIKEVGVTHPLVQKKIKKTLKLSIQEGSLSSIYNGLTQRYLAPFALAMNATSAQAGIIGGLEYLCPAITQLFSCRLIEKNSRKKIIITGLIIRTLIWIPIILTSMLFFHNIPHTIWILIGLIGMSYIFYAVVHPAWFSLMGSLVPKETRGDYFAKRNRYAQVFGVISMILSAIFLDYMKEIGSVNGQTIAYTLLGFSILFTIAIMVRLYCAVLFARHYEPRLRIKKKDHYTMRQFIKNMKNDAFGRFTIFNSSFRFAVGIASPFIVVYIIRDLNYSYTWYMAIIVAQIISQIIFLKIIGKISDRYGNILLTKMSSVIISLTPLTFFLSYFIPIEILTKVYLIFFAQLLNGIGWAGFNLASSNYIYDAMQKEKQGYGLAYMNFFNGVAFFLGTVLGSIIIKNYNGTIGIVLFVFLISFIARAMIAIFASGILKEVRDVKKFKPDFLLHQVHPIKGTMNELHHLYHPNTQVVHHI